MTRLISSLVRLLLFIAATCVASMLPLQVSAQSSDEVYVPPSYVLDRNNFDMNMGFITDVPLVSIGDPQAGGLELSMRRTAFGPSRTLTGAYSAQLKGDVWRFSLGGYASSRGSVNDFRTWANFGLEKLTFDSDIQNTLGPPSGYLAPGEVVLPSLISFNLTNGIFAHFASSGASLRSSFTIYHTDGRKIEFASYWLQSIEYPNGVRQTYHYTIFGSERDHRRLQSITTNTGYMLHFTYHTDPTQAEINAGIINQNWYKVTKVTGINTSVYPCGPTSYQCSDSQGANWPYVILNNLNGRHGPVGWKRLDSIENRYGHKMAFRYAPAPLATENYNLTGVSSPQDPAVDDFALTISLSSQIPSNDTAHFDATINGQLWTYTVKRRSTMDTGVVTGPDGYSASWRVEDVGFLDQVLYDVTEIRINGRRWICRTGCSLEYDSITRAKAITLPGGRKEVLAYNSRGVLTQRLIEPETGGLGGSINYRWGYTDPSEQDSTAKYINWRNYNKPISYTDPRNKVYSYINDPNHGQNLNRKAPAPGAGAYASVRPETRTTYGDVGGAIVKPDKQSSCAISAACGSQATELVTTFTYNAQNKRVETVTVKGGDGSAASTTKTYYTPQGDVEATDGPLPGTGDTTRFYYDDLRRLRAEVSPDPDGPAPLPHQVVRYTYNADGNVTIEDRGHVASPANWNSLTLTGQTKFYYDAYGRKIREEAIHIGGAQNGQVGRLTQFNYDGRGRLKCTAVRMNPAAFSSLPDACVVGTEGAHGPDRITRNYYTTAGELERVVDGLGTPLQRDYKTYAYNADGTLKSVKDANGNLTSYEYDGFNRLIKTKFPSKTTAGQSSDTDYETYAYDDAGNRISWRKRDGSVINYTYDNLNRMVVKDIPGGTAEDVHYGYDLHNLEIYARFASTGGQGLSNSYDAVGRLISATSDLTSTTISYDYDAAGNRTRVTHPDDAPGSTRYFDYVYDSAGRLTEIKEPSASWISQIAYKPAGRIDRLKHRDRFDWVAGYDGLSRFSSFTIDASVMASDDLTESFTFNPASQLTSRSISNDDYLFRLGPNGAVAYSANGLNQYDSIGGVATSHDANGNMTDDGEATYGYDVENRLTSATTSGGTVTLKYDPYGRLYEVAGRVVTRFVYDGDALIAELDGSNALLRRYVHGAGVDDPLVWYEGTGVDDASRRHLAKNYQGSVIGVAATGASIEKNSYDPFGVPDPWNSGRFAYTGQVVVPELGLYYYKARIYSPHIGRFLQTDPIGYEDNLNLYAYVNNDPVNNIDPTGLACVDIEGTECFDLDGPATIEAAIFEVAEATHNELSTAAQSKNTPEEFAGKLNQALNQSVGNKAANQNTSFQNMATGTAIRDDKGVLTVDGVDNRVDARASTSTARGLDPLSSSFADSAEVLQDGAAIVIALPNSMNSARFVGTNVKTFRNVANNTGATVSVFVNSRLGIYVFRPRQ